MLKDLHDPSPSWPYGWFMAGRVTAYFKKSYSVLRRQRTSSELPTPLHHVTDDLAQWNGNQHVGLIDSQKTSQRYLATDVPS